MSFITELKRRNVFRVAAVYTIVAWLLVQVASVLFPTFHAPDWVMQVIVILTVLGFPLAVVLAWALELTPEGIKLESKVEPDTSITRSTGHKLNITIIVLLALALSYVVFDNYVLKEEPQPVATSGEAAPSPAAASATEDHRSIAVLPFVNMSSDPEQEFFSDGLSEEILNLLAKVSELKVIGRTSSFAFKGKNQDLREIGKALGVGTVLEGSVRTSGERVRITAQLIDVSNGAHLWSDTYDRTLTDIFAVQDDVASAILEALQLQIGVTPSRGRPTDNTEAYRLFLQAKAAMHRWDSVEAEQLVREAVTLDPDFAEAWEMLAYAYWEQWGNTIDTETAIAKIEVAASKALAIAPDLAFAKVLMLTTDGFTQVAKEIAALEYILIEDPGNFSAAEILIYYLLLGGYFNEALERAEWQVDKDPLSANAHLNLSLALGVNGRREEALEAMEVSAELGSMFANGNLAWFAFRDGRYEEAISFEEASAQQWGLQTNWVRDFHQGMRDSADAEEFMDRRIPEIVAAQPEEQRYSIIPTLDLWYQILGLVDRFYEIIFQRVESTGYWGEAETLIYVGLTDFPHGFWSHPRFLEMAKSSGLTSIWEERGAPDLCTKVDDDWVCGVSSLEGVGE